MQRALVLAALLIAALASCGEARDPLAEPGKPAASPTAYMPADGPVRAVTTVVDAGDGTVMCLVAAGWSVPPQCDGPKVSGWAWEDYPDHESASGARWGEFVLTGEWDGTSFAPTEVRAATQNDSPHTEYEPPTTSCEEPEGGWRVIDPETTTAAARDATARVAEELPDYGQLWVDQSINPLWQDSLEGENSLELEQGMNDPALTIVNVGVTGDPAAAEAELRKVWGGSLCVYRVANTMQRLREVAEELGGLPGGLGPQFGTISNRVELPVVYDDGSIQAWADQEYGANVVEVSSALTPVADVSAN